MNDWPSARIGDVCTFFGGGTPARGNSTFFGGAIPWVTPKDMKTWEIHGSEITLTEAGLDNSPTKLVPANAILVVVRSGVLKHTVPIALSKVPVTINQDMKALVCSDFVYPDFLARFLKYRSPHILRWVRATTADNFPVDKLKNLEIPLPSVPEQRRIAEILDKADALRAKRRAALAKLDTLTQSIFLDMFGDPKTGPRKRLSMPFGEAYWFQEGPGVRKWQFKEQGVKLLNVGNIEKDGKLNLEKTDRHLATEEAFGKYRHFLVDAGDLVIASSGISFDDDGLLRTRGAFVEDEHLPLCMNTSTIRFKAKDGVSDLRFLLAWLDGEEFRRQITRFVTGSAQQNFGPSHLSSLTITLPALAAQREFARRVTIVDKIRTAHRRSRADLNTLFASLQHQEFRG